MGLLPIAISAVLLFLLLLFTAVLGKRSNDKRALAWWQSIALILQEQMTNVDETLHSLSWSDYEGFAAGKDSVAYVLAALHLIPRQEFFCGSLLRHALPLVMRNDPTSMTTWCTRDRLILEFGIRGIEERCSFVLGRKMRIGRLKSIEANLSEIIDRKQMAILDNSPFCCLSESQTLINMLSTFPVFQELAKCILMKNAGDFISLHMSDLLLSKRYMGQTRHVLRLEIALPSNMDVTNLKQILSLTFGLIEQLTKMGKNQNMRMEVEKARQPLMRAMAEEDREIEEKKRAEAEAARLAAMTPEEKMKQEQKRQRKAQRGRVKLVKR